MQFLNSAASLVINRLLGDYVSNVDTQNVSFSLSGMLTLHQLQLKSTALDKLGLPIKVRSGSISKLHLQVPLRSSTPAVIDIEDLYILACPASRSSDDVRHLKAEKDMSWSCFNSKRFNFSFTWALTSRYRLMLTHLLY